ncbi:MAG: GTP-binding protein [Ruminococcaceae bacterium]|nr:GTP-binding protein [Oscillospiraceae bacterium]
MTKVDIFSGFLGAGKTTLIKKLIAEAYAGQKLVLIENEFGEIGIDSGFMQEAGIQVNELNSGCICCSLVGDFSQALHKVVEEYAPDRILIEPSGVGKLSDIIRAVAAVDGVEVNSATTVADAGRVRMFMKNFGEFYSDQITCAGAIVLSRTQNVSEEKLDSALELLREQNPDAVIITTPWDALDGSRILEAVERTDTLEAAMKELVHDHAQHHHDHHGHEHHHHEGECSDPHCGCHEHHEHHHHDHHGHEHHHHEGECSDPHCSCHDHGHDADEVFVSWGVETAKKFTEAEMQQMLSALDDAEKFGMVLRAKGIVDSGEGQWIYFDHVPGEAQVRRGAPGVIGRLCVIGSGLNKDALKALFGV